MPRICDRCGRVGRGLNGLSTPTLGSHSPSIPTACTFTLPLELLLKQPIQHELRAKVLTPSIKEMQFQPQVSLTQGLK